MSSPLIIGYLFLGGAGAGMLLVLAAMGFLSPRRDLDVDGSGRLRPLGVYARFYGLGFAASVVVCVVAALCLVFDMARPDAILGMLLRPNASIVFVGACALGLCIALGAALTLLWLAHARPRIAFVRASSALAIVVALVVMAYTGLLLGLIPHVAFWQSPLVVVLFVLSSLSCGIALVVLAMTAFRLVPLFWEPMRGILLLDAALVVLEAAALAAFLALSQQSAPEAVGDLLSGRLATVFWTGLVGAGLVVPLAIELSLRTRAPLAAQPCVPAALVLVGGLCLRICVVFAA